MGVVELCASRQGICHPADWLVQMVEQYLAEACTDACVGCSGRRVFPDTQAVTHWEIGPAVCHLAILVRLDVYKGWHHSAAHSEAGALPTSPLAVPASELQANWRQDAVMITGEARQGFRVFLLASQAMPSSNIPRFISIKQAYIFLAVNKCSIYGVVIGSSHPKQKAAYLLPG